MNDVPDPEWAQLLDTFYRQNCWMYSYTRSGVYHEELPEENYIHNHINFHPDDKHNPVNTLIIMGLVESKESTEIPARMVSKKDGVSWYQLTKKGFSVAHDRYTDKQQQNLLKERNNSNKLVVVFTVLLAFTAVIQAVSQVISLEGHQAAVGILYFVLAMIAIFISNEVFSDVSIFDAE